MIKKYRKLPVVIEAIKLTYENCKYIRNFIDKDFFVKWVYELPDGSYGEEQNIFVAPCMNWRVVQPKLGLIIKTLEGELLAVENDYIIKGIKGEFYPCKPNIFEATYEEASETICSYAERRMKDNVTTEAIKDHLHALAESEPLNYRR